KDVRVQEGVLGRDHLGAPESRTNEGTEELVPVSQVQDARLGVLECVELRLALIRRELASIQILAPQDLVHALQSPTPKTKSYRDPKQLVGVGLDEVVEG